MCVGSRNLKSANKDLFVSLPIEVVICRDSDILEIYEYFFAFTTIKS